MSSARSRWPEHRRGLGSSRAATSAASSRGRPTARARPRPIQEPSGGRLRGAIHRRDHAGSPPRWGSRFVGRSRPCRAEAGLGYHDPADRASRPGSAGPQAWAEIRGPWGRKPSIASRSESRHGCLYCSTVPPLRESRRRWKSAQEPAGMRNGRIGPSRRVSRLFSYSRFTPPELRPRPRRPAGRRRRRRRTSVSSTSRL